MSEKNRKAGKFTVGAAALLFALSISGCSSSEPTENNAETTTTAATTTAEAETTTEAPAETETEAETTAEAETTTTEAPKETEETTKKTEKATKEEETEETKAVTGELSDDFDKELDDMIASAEALIDEYNDIDFSIDLNVSDSKASDEKKTDDKKEDKETTTATTTTAKVEEPKADTADDVKNEQQLIFDGVLYDNTTFTSKGVTKPASWVIDPEISSGLQYKNDAYPNSYIAEGNSKGVSFLIVTAKRNGDTSYPSLQLYKGLTWGASADDIKAAFGAPAKESNKDHYGTSMTNLFYIAADGSTIVYEVSSDWGLIVVDCFGK